MSSHPEGPRHHHQLRSPSPRQRPNQRSGTLAVTTIAFIVALSGCVDGGPTLDGTVELDAKVTKFDEATYEALAGDVTFSLHNSDAIPHSLIIEGIDGFRLNVVGFDETVEDTITLEAGTYDLICDITGHREQGMVATLEVVPDAG